MYLLHVVRSFGFVLAGGVEIWELGICCDLGVCSGSFLKTSRVNLQPLLFPVTATAWK